MWDILTSGFFDILAKVMNFASATTATIMLLGAIAFYIYSFIDRRIPGVVVAPVVGVLVYAAAWIFGNQAGVVAEKHQCEVRNANALKELNDRYLQTSTQLRGLQEQYANQRIELERQHTQEQAELRDTINRLEIAEDEVQRQLEAERIKNENEENQPPQQSRPSIVYVPSSRCFSTTVPDDILRSINRAGRSN